MNESPIRILEIIPSADAGGGIESFIMNYFRNVDRTKVMFDFLVHEISDCSYADEIEALGGKIYLFPKLSIKSMKKVCKKYATLLDNEEYKIIHCHLANAAFIYLRIAKKKGVPIRILHSHQDRAADLTTHVLRNIPLLAIGKKYANKRAACSKQAGDYLFGSHTYQIIRNGINYSDYQYSEAVRNIVRHECGIMDNEIVIGHTGRLTPQKNQKFLIEIFKYIQKKIPSKLLIVGDGEDKQMLMELTEKLELSEYVIFTGVRKDIPSLLCAMDIFVFPSLYEGLGISLLEAQASGLTCYCSDSIPKEANISDNVTFLSLKFPPDFWAEEIVKYIETRTDRKFINILDNQYNISQCAQKLTEYYRNFV